MKMITCTECEHAVAILDIFNDAILTSTALYDYKLRHIDSMTPWFATKLTNNFPVLGLEDGQGTLLGLPVTAPFAPGPSDKRLLNSTAGWIWPFISRSLIRH